MLQHLRATYGQVTPDDIEQNHSLLSADWNPDDPIEDVWLCLRDCQGYATAADEPITNSAAIRLTLAVFEKMASLPLLSTNGATSLSPTKCSTLSKLTSILKKNFYFIHAPESPHLLLLGRADSAFGNYTFWRSTS
jgi:hypothetical protein